MATAATISRSASTSVPTSVSASNNNSNNNNVDPLSLTSQLHLIPTLTLAQYQLTEVPEEHAIPMSRTINVEDHIDTNNLDSHRSFDAEEYAMELGVDPFEYGYDRAYNTQGAPSSVYNNNGNGTGNGNGIEFKRQDTGLSFMSENISESFSHSHHQYRRQGTKNISMDNYDSGNDNSIIDNNNNDITNNNNNNNNNNNGSISEINKNNNISNNNSNKKKETQNTTTTTTNNKPLHEKPWHVATAIGYVQYEKKKKLIEMPQKKRSPDMKIFDIPNNVDNVKLALKYAVIADEEREQALQDFINEAKKKPKPNSLPKDMPIPTTPRTRAKYVSKTPLYGFERDFVLTNNTYRSVFNASDRKTMISKNPSSNPGPGTFRHEDYSRAIHVKDPKRGSWCFQETNDDFKISNYPQFMRPKAFQGSLKKTNQIQPFKYNYLYSDKQYIKNNPIDRPWTTPSICTEIKASTRTYCEGFTSKAARIKEYVTNSNEKSGPGAFDISKADNKGISVRNPHLQNATFVSKKPRSSIKDLASGSDGFKYHASRGSMPINESVNSIRFSKKKNRLNENRNDSLAKQYPGRTDDRVYGKTGAKIEGDPALERHKKVKRPRLKPYLNNKKTPTALNERKKGKSVRAVIPNDKNPPREVIKKECFFGMVSCGFRSTYDRSKDTRDMAPNWDHDNSSAMTRVAESPKEPAVKIKDGWKMSPAFTAIPRTEEMFTCNMTPPNPNFTPEGAFDASMANKKPSAVFLTPFYNQHTETTVAVKDDMKHKLARVEKKIKSMHLENEKNKKAANIAS